MSCSARPASANCASSSTVKSERNPAHAIPAGASAPPGSSAAQHCMPASRPRYRVLAAPEPSQLWFFCNGSFAQAGLALTRRSSLGATVGPISTSSSSPRNTNQSASGCAPVCESPAGPVGQVISNGVGLAPAARLLAAEFNRPEHAIVDHYTYAFLVDGCMMEGVSHESCALAGTLGLSKLIAIYDDNGISIDSDKGQIKQWYTDDVRRRFESYGWQVIPNVDGHDVEAVDRAIRKAKREKSRPTLICAKTTIAKGAPKKANTGAAHGAPLGADEIAATRAAIGWSHAPFEVPQAVYDSWDAREAGKRAERRWKRIFKSYEEKFPAEAAEFKRRMAAELPAAFEPAARRVAEEFNQKAETLATRRASQLVLDALKPVLPELIGGSADLTGSNPTMAKTSKPIGPASSPNGGGGDYIFFCGGRVR